jgi:hypothetical protein
MFAFPAWLLSSLLLTPTAELRGARNNVCPAFSADAGRRDLTDAHSSSAHCTNFRCRAGLD